MAQVKERGGGGEERKETLADKPRDFENHPLGTVTDFSLLNMKYLFTYFLSVKTLPIDKSTCRKILSPNLLLTATC